MVHSGPNIKMVMIVTALILGTFATFVSIGIKVAYGSDERNDPCYNAGFNDGQSQPYNQTKYDECGNNGRAYYEGFLSGCISGQGKDYFSCQKTTNAPVGGGN